MQTLISIEGDRILEIARQNRVVVILLNYQLPGKMRGWDVLKALKADPVLCNIPVVTYEINNGQQVYQDNQADACLQMPLLYESFRETIENLGLEINQASK